MIDVHNEANLFGGRNEVSWWSTYERDSCQFKFFQRDPACPSDDEFNGRLTHMDRQSEDAYQVFLTFGVNKMRNQGENLRLLEHTAPLWWGLSTPPWLRE